MSVEPNNTILEANDSRVNSDNERSVIIDSSIDLTSDVDLYRFPINEGEGITFDIDADELDSGLDPVLRLFDADGNEIGKSDDRPAPGEIFSLDSYLTFIARDTGIYYVGVSSVDNVNYDPNSNSNVTDGSTTGDYQLAIDLVEVVPEDDPDDTIAEATATGLDTPETSASFTNKIDVGRDIDLYQLQLDAGDGLILDIDAAELGFSLDSQLRLFDSDGNELAQSDDNPNLGEDFSTDSYLTYTAEVEGDYYVGVSTSGNADYDPIDGRTNLFVNDSTNSGDYELNIEIVEIKQDNDPDNTIAEATVSEIIDPDLNFVVIEDSINPQGDVDVFALSLDAGETAIFDLDAANINTGLDSALLLFDKDGNELDFNDDGVAPGEDLSAVDSYIEFTAETEGDYYIAVSGFPNVEYDVIGGRDNLGFDAENFSVGDYELTINTLDNIEGTNDGDILFGNSTSTSIQGLQGDDRLTGGGNNDYFRGNSGNDTLSGNNGNDTLIGGTGFDYLLGGEGADILQGDNGNNLLRGAAGADIFVLFKTNKTTDTILDFEDGSDRLLLGNGSSFSDLTVEDLPSGGVSLVENERKIAEIVGIQANDLSEADFVTSIGVGAI